MAKFAEILPLHAHIFRSEFSETIFRMRVSAPHWPYPSLLSTLGVFGVERLGGFSLLFVSVGIVSSIKER